MGYSNPNHYNCHRRGLAGALVAIVPLLVYSEKTLPRLLRPIGKDSIGVMLASAIGLGLRFSLVWHEFPWIFITPSACVVMIEQLIMVLIHGDDWDDVF
jgi:hypothetical protein